MPRGKKKEAVKAAPKGKDATKDDVSKVVVKPGLDKDTTINVNLQSGSENGLIAYDKTAIHAEITKPTPPQFIKKTRKPGGTFPYVQAPYLRERLTEIFGVGGWDFEIMGDPQIIENMVAVKGRLTVKGKDSAGNIVRSVQEQWGGTDIKRYDSGEREGEMISLGNNLKSAATDAFKKCCGSLGFAQEVFGNDTLSQKIEDDAFSNAREANVELDEKKLDEKKRKETIVFIKNFIKDNKDSLDKDERQRNVIKKRIEDNVFITSSDKLELIDVLKGIDGDTN